MISKIGSMARRSIYITGATGFLGRELVKQLAPVSQLALPIRGKDQHTPHQRYAELFGHVPHTALATEMIPTDTEVVILNAYDVRFTGTLKSALQNSVDPMLRLLEQCQTLPRLRKVVIVSTAYVCPPSPGTYCEGLVTIDGVEDLSQLYVDALAGKTQLSKCWRPIG